MGRCAAVLVVCWMAARGGAAKAQSETDAVAPGAQTLLLWPAGAPGAKGDTAADKPQLTVFPPTSNPTRTAVIVAPGGGYQNLAMEHEGYAEARWLAAHGIAAFVLRYRLGPVYHHPVELGDAQRAIRLLRSQAAQFGLAADHIGMMGFSAGGHLAATAGTMSDRGDPAAADPVDRQGSRPDFLVLGYPVISMEDADVHRGSRSNLLGEHPSPETERRLSADQQVTSRTPPTFLFATTDDAIVPVTNSVLFYLALVRAGVPAEMHLFAHGNHGFGMAAGDPELGIWPQLLLTWMRSRGLAGPEVTGSGR